MNNAPLNVTPDGFPVANRSISISARSKFVKKSLNVVFATSLIILCITETAFANPEIDRTFSFGLGTGLQSHKRTFPVPCHVGIEGVVVTYKRLGPAGSANDIPIIVELRSPGPSATEEGPVVDSRTVVAKTSEKVIDAPDRLKGDPSPRGCSLPWIVRVKPASGNAPYVISGIIRLFYFGGGDSNVSVEGESISLNKGNSVTKNVGDNSGLHAGKISVTGTWLHSAFGVPGPLPVKLTFQLLNPAGSIVASKTAFSAAEVNPCCSGNKMSFTAPVNQHITGQWKLRITNNTSDDTMNIDPKVTYTSVCQ